MGAKHHKRWYTGVIHTHARTAPAVCWIKLTHVDPQCPYTDCTTHTPLVCAIRPRRIRFIGMAAAMGAKHHKRWYTGVIHTHARTAPAVCWIKLIHVDPQCPYTDYTTRTPRMRDSPLHQRPFDARSIHRGCARPSCADRSPRCWVAHRTPSSHRLPSQHDLPCSRHSVSHVAQSRRATAAPTAVTTNGESIARSTPRLCPTELR